MLVVNKADLAGRRSARCATSRTPSHVRFDDTRRAGRRPVVACSAATGDGVEARARRRSTRTARTSRRSGLRRAAAAPSALAQVRALRATSAWRTRSGSGEGWRGRARAELARPDAAARRLERHSILQAILGRACRRHRRRPGSERHERSHQAHPTGRSGRRARRGKRPSREADSAATRVHDDLGRAAAAALRPGGRARSTTSATSASRASSRSRAACTRRCTAAASGRCASSRASAARAQTNERFKFLLEHGQTGLSIAFDFPTLMGYDSDHPSAASARSGRSASRSPACADMETLIDGIPMERGLDLDDDQRAGADPARVLHRLRREPGRRPDGAARHGAERHPQGVHGAERVARARPSPRCA